MNDHRGSYISAKSFSLLYNDLARWLSITLVFVGMLSTGWFGIPLVPRYLALNQIDILASLFTLFSALVSIWGIMAYQEFTRTGNLVKAARDLARKLDPMIGDYEYHSFNPETKEYEKGYVPLGPIDFWDKETQAPSWLDKGKYWHILLGLQASNREVILQVVKDQDLPFTSGVRNVAVTYKILDPGSGASFLPRVSRRKSRYRVRIPQWSVMNTERVRFVEQNERLNLEGPQLNYLIAELNKNLVRTADEIIEREKPRIQYPWPTTAFGIYLNKSLPLQVIYRRATRHFPGLKKRIINDTNENLANLQDEELAAALMELATQKGISIDRTNNLHTLMEFLKNAYSKQGIGEGSSEYHNFHHSLEVGYMSLQMMPKQFHNHNFSSRDYELILIAALLHDYDPAQVYSSTEQRDMKEPKGPEVKRTINEIRKTRIHDAYFTMNRNDFEDYFREYETALSPAIEFATTHPEYLKPVQKRPIESIIVEALIWRTDFPYLKQKHSQERFLQLLAELENQGQDLDKIQLIGEILWLTDLSVTYMSSDPIRAWDRVSNLYDELYLPRVEAVSRTDAFFSDFAENESFKELIRDRRFPDIFRQRWTMIYNFFHEGNPSTQLSRTVTMARKLYIKVNVEIRMKHSEVLEEMAVNNWAEYFIAIGKDQKEVLKAKSKFAALDPQNAASFWGDPQKLLPNIADKSIDNFLLILSQNLNPLNTNEEKLFARSLLAVLALKLVKAGTLQILTDSQEDSVEYRELIKMVLETDFERDLVKPTKVYFKIDRKYPEFTEGRIPQVLIFRPKQKPMVEK
jgi:tRNA G46 methylase TrmB